MNPKADRSFITIISLLCALNAFLAETNLMQYISATLGGTLFTFQLGTGLFVASLGFGSLTYPFVHQYLSNQKILFVSTLGLAAVSLLSIPWVHWIDSLVINDSWLQTFCATLPLVLIGLITGLDLPALIFWGKERNTHQEEKILGLDYFGMFLACLCFPFLYMSFGNIFVYLVILLISFINLSLIYLEPKSSFQKTSLLKKTPNRIKKATAFLCFAFSFCSLSYELLLARWMIDFFENEIFAITFCIGFYLLGLAFGALSFKLKNLAHQFILTEIAICLSMLILPVLFLCLASLWKGAFYHYLPSQTLQTLCLLVVVWVGFWSGKELPLLLNLPEIKTETDVSKIFLWNYLGALGATAFVPLFTLPQIGFYPSVLLVVSINMLTLFILRIKLKINFKKLIFALALPLVALFTTPNLHHYWKQTFLKTLYHNLELHDFSHATIRTYLQVSSELNDIHRIQTPYQNIDLVRSEIPLTGSSVDELTLYLNKQPQFSISKIDLYHDSFSEGAINLHQKTPKNVLILGGGDGFLAAKLVQHQGIKSITLVELDQKIIELANHYPRISQYNKNVFNDPKVKLVIGDAFSWLKKNRKTFDAIFIDFPYPTNYETLRLYSLEFYQLVFQNLDDYGFMVFDAPFSFDLEKNNKEALRAANTLLASVEAAGFKSWISYGVIEPFLYVEKQERKLYFDYNKMKGLANTSFVNLAPLVKIKKIPGWKDVNSVYKPRKVTTW